MSGPPSGLIPKTNNSSLGLGAAGGPRGAAAGVTQILVNFLLNYDRGNSEKIAADIKKFEADREAANDKLLAANQRLVALEKTVVDARKANAQISKTNQVSLNALANTQQRINSLVQKQNEGSGVFSKLLDFHKTRKAELIAQIQAETGLSRQQITNAARLVSLEDQLVTAAYARKAAVEGVAVATERVTAAQRAQAAVGQMGKAAAGRLGGLAIGLIGGTIGGAAFTALLEPLQGALDSLAKGFQQLVDPANAARESVSRLADEVNELADSENISRLEAAAKLLERISAIQPGAPSANTPENRELLERLAINSQLTPILQQQLDLLRAQQGTVSGITGENRDILRQITLQKLGISDLASPYAAHNQVLSFISLSYGNILNQQQAIDNAINAQSGSLLEAGGHQADLTAEAERTAAAERDAAQAAAQLRSEIAGAAIEQASAGRIAQINTDLQGFIGTINTETAAHIKAIDTASSAAMGRLKRAGDARVDQLQQRLGNLELRPSARTRGLERQLDALKDSGPSKRTNELAAAIERLNRAAEQASFRAQLNEIAEQKQQILLRERLRLSRQEIDIDDYRGKNKLIAIDVLLEKMQKQNEAQDRFNRLLGIQYQIQQGVRRQQGETIAEFTARRAQYYRDLLQQASELQREGPQAELEAEKERVQTSIDLKELEERRRKLIEDRARQDRLRDLQAQLRASQERDRRELENRRESLQKQLEASRKADQAALESRREALRRQIDAVRDSTQRQIQAVQNQRDKEIAARELARDKAIEAAQKTAERAIEAERRRAEQLKKWADYGESQRMQAAFRGATSIAELNRFAGALSGANFSINYIRSQLNALGVDQFTQQTILQNVTAQRNTYLQQLAKLSGRDVWWTQGRIPGFAEGGFVRLNNSNTPLSGDVRWGDGQGDEGGMFILNNKIMSAIREQQRNGAMIENMTFVTQDPWRDSWRFRRTVEDVVKGVLN